MRIMEEVAVKKEEKIPTPNKSTVKKEMEVIQMDEFDGNYPDVPDERSKLEENDMHEPEYDETSVFLSWYDSDLNLIIDESNFTAASPLHDDGFGFLQAGARATFGYMSGKVCFEVKLLQNCKLKYKKGYVLTHLLRVGWSSAKSCLQLGKGNKSYGYDNNRKISSKGEMKDYGVEFKIGDVVGAFLEIDDESVTLSFTVNGEDQGIAYKIPQSDFQKEPLFPHVETKNISYECNFKGEKPWFAPKEGFTFVGDVPLTDRISGPKRPKSKSDCEVIMMCGLPKSGKTEWVNDLCEKNPGKYYVIDVATLIDKEEIRDPSCKEVIHRKAKVLGRLLAMAMDRKRNYILDQINLVRSEQIWKLRFFKGFKRKIVVVVLPDKEYQERSQPLTESLEDLSWLYQCKAKFVLPVIKSTLNKLVDEISYVALGEKEALKLVIRYQREAWYLGYKPFKSFVVPIHVLKEMKRRGLSRKTLRTKLENKNNPGAPIRFKARVAVYGKRKKIPESLSVPQKRKNPSWPSVPMKRANEGWHSPPRQKTNEDRASPPRKRKEAWPSPSRNKGNEHWQSPHRNRSGSDMRSPPRSRTHDNWPQERRGRVSESPPRFRPAGRNEPREGLLITPPRSRIEEWQSRGPGSRVEPLPSPRRRSRDNLRRPSSRSPPRDRMDPHSSERRRYQASSRSPPRDRIDPHSSERSRYHEREGGGYRHPHDNRADRGHMPPRVAMNEDRPTQMPDEFPPQGQHIHQQGGRMGGHPPPVRNKSSSGIMDDGFSHKPREQTDRDPLSRREHGVSHGLSPHEAKIGGGFPPGDARMGRNCPSPRRDYELPQEGRFGRGVPSHEEQFVGRIQNKRLESGFLPVENRMNEGYLPQEGRVADDFPPEDIRVLMSNRPSEGRAVGMVRIHEGHADRGYSPPRGQRGNDRPLPASSQMVGGFPSHERRPDIRLPETRGAARNLSPESIMVIDIHPREGRSIELVPPDRVRIGAEYPLQRGRGSENLPEHAGRGRMLPPENRMIERIVDDLPPQRMSGDLPPGEGRIGSNFHSGPRLGGNMPPHSDRSFQPRGIPLRDASPSHDRDYPSSDGRMMSDFPPHDVRMMGGFPRHEEKMTGNFASRGSQNFGDLPSTEGRSGGNVMHYERMSGDFPSRGSRVGGGDVPSQHDRMVGDVNFPAGGRSDVPHHGGDMPPPGGRIGAAFPHQGRIGNNMISPGRMVADLPPGGRMGSNDFSPDARIGMPPHPGRIGGEPLHHREQFGSGGTFQGGRSMVDHIPRARFDGDMPPREMRMGDLQHLEGRSGPDEHWNRLPSNPDQLNYGPRIKQEPSNAAEFLQHKGGNDGRNKTWGDWDRSKSDYPSDFQPSIKQEPIIKSEFRPEIKQEPLIESGFRNREPDIHQNQWSSQDVQHRSFQDGGNNSGPGPSFHFSENREDGGRGPRAWRPEEPSNRGWNSEEIHDRERLPSNSSRDRPRSSPQKQQRLVGSNIPNIRYRVGEDEEHDSHEWRQKASEWVANKKRDLIGRGGHKNLPEEDEGLAPYEQPFDQSLWDSNEPENTHLHQGADDRSGRTREGVRNRVQDLGPRSATKPGSVWQRVGGYVDDDDDDNFATSQHFDNPNPGNRFGSSKERSYEDSNAGRRLDVREGREDPNQFSSHRSDRGFPKGGSRGNWKSTDKKQMGRW